jgi:cyclic pyranopterin phosphate synthase
MNGDLTHFDSDGRPRMVDVSLKTVSERTATASARVRMGADAFAAVLARRSRKGDPCATAELAGVMGAKRSADLIPLCHPVALAHVAVETHPDERDQAVLIVATAKTTAQTGVEMEAMTAAAVAALTLYDMLKAIDKEITIEAVRLERKTGGKSGDFARSER